MADETTVLVRIDGEPFLSRAMAYFAELDVAAAAWQAFALKVGATSLSNPLGALGFDGPPPAGWIAKTRNGRSRPKSGTAAAAEMAALPQHPCSRLVFGDAVIYDLSYDMPCGGFGSGGIGLLFFGPPIARADGVMVARIPHAGRAAAQHLACHPDHTIRYGAADWKIPDGLVEISEAEMKFMFAKAELDRERAARAA